MKSKRHWKTSSFGFAFILQAKGVSGVTLNTCDLYFEVCCYSHATFILRCVVIVGEGFSKLGILSNIFPFPSSNMLLVIRGRGFWYLICSYSPSKRLLWRILHLWGLRSFHLVPLPPFRCFVFLWWVDFKISIDCTMENNYPHKP